MIGCCSFAKGQNGDGNGYSLDTWAGVGAPAADRDLCLGRGRSGPDRGQVRRLARNGVGRAAVESGRLAARCRRVPRQPRRGSACDEPGRPRASLRPRQGRAAGGARPIGLHHRQRDVAACRSGAAADLAGSGREPAGRYRRDGLFDRRDDRARCLSAACRAAHRVDCDQRRRAALPQRCRVEFKRHRRVRAGQHLRFSAARSAVRRCDRYLDRLFRRDGWRACRCSS